MDLRVAAEQKQWVEDRRLQHDLKTELIKEGGSGTLDKPWDAAGGPPHHLLSHT